MKIKNQMKSPWNIPKLKRFWINMKMHKKIKKYAIHNIIKVNLRIW